MFVNANTKLVYLQVLCGAGTEDKSVKPASPTASHYPLSETVSVEKKYTGRTEFSEDTKYF